MKKINIYEAEEAYKYVEPGMFDEFNEQYLVVLGILNDTECITPMEKRIFILYLEAGSSRKAAEYCSIKYRQIAYIVSKVKVKILNELGKNKNYGFN